MKKILFHLVRMHVQFKANGEAFIKISNRYGMKANGEKKLFKDADYVHVPV